MSQAVAHASQQAPSLAPSDLPTAFRLADMMANASLVPRHLQGKPADCLLVIEQAVRWSMSPFAVAQATSVIGGKLMYEGKLVAAAINSSGLLSDRLAYDFTGAGDLRTVTVTGTIRGETKAREAAVILRDVRTANEMWKKQPDQQLVYSGARVWARRHAPEVMLGVYTPDEFDEPQTLKAQLVKSLEDEETRGAARAVLAKPPPPDRPLTEKFPTVDDWLEKIADAGDIDELGQVSQAISKARLADDVLAKLRGAFIKRRVELSPTSQPPPVLIDPPEHDPETGEIVSEPQGAPPSSEEPGAATDEPAPAEAAQQPAMATDAPEVARHRGATAFRAGATRKAIPGPYRGTPLQLEWFEGFDKAAEAESTQ